MEARYEYAQKKMSGSLQRRRENSKSVYIYQSKKDVHEQFRRKMNEDVNGNRKLFWKEASKVNGGKVGYYSKIKG